MTPRLRFLLNDQEISLGEVGAADTLLDFLRISRRLTGTANGTTEHSPPAPTARGTRRPGVNTPGGTGRGRRGPRPSPNRPKTTVPTYRYVSHGRRTRLSSSRKPRLQRARHRDRRPRWRCVTRERVPTSHFSL